MPHSAISRLSNHKLVANLQHMVSDERRRLVEILEHLSEVERRRLHLEMGYSSLYDYCVNGLRYSRSAADRRIVTARALRRFPEVGELLGSGAGNLTTVSMIARLMTPANGRAMLARIHGKSQRDVERIVDEYRPEARTRDRVRTVSVRERVEPGTEPESRHPQATPGAGSESGRIANSTNSAESTWGHSAIGAGPADDQSSRAPAAATSGAHAPNTSTPTGEPPLVTVVQKHEIRFIASRSFTKKLQRMKALLSNRAPNATFEQVFDAAMECYLDQHCPVRRHQRRKAKKRNTTKKKASSGCTGSSAAPGIHAGTAASTATETPRRPLPAPGVTPPRRIPIAHRDAVHARDRGQCTFVGPGGRRCSARHHLHIDHIVPYAHGGGHDPANLRLLCRAHNLLAAEHAFGREVMSRYARRDDAPG